MKQKIRKGFTLAEVLITLAIIGIISALTIPSIILHHRNMELKDRFLKAYSDIDKAIRTTQIETGNSLVESRYDNLYFDTFYKQFGIYTQTSKKLIQTGWASTVMYSGNRNGPPRNTMYYTEKGDMLLFAYKGISWCCAFVVIVDTNGTKGPNRWGYDLFRFSVHSGYKKGMALRSNGCPYPWDCSDCTGDSYGYNCGYWAIRDINPDDHSKKYWDSLR